MAESGKMKIEWAEARMPVLMALREKSSKTKPLAGHRVAGAELIWSGCNPMSTQDDIAAALAVEGVSIYAWHGLSRDDFYWAIERTLDFKPTLTLDDGADLINTVHLKHPELIGTIVGGTDETTTGVHRPRSMAAAGALKYPVMAVNDAETRWDVDNVYGTGQSSLDGILRATSVLLAGKNVVVGGFGHCGRGVAMRAKGIGSHVAVTEVKPTAALKAILEGIQVMADGRRIYLLGEGRRVNLAAAAGPPSEVMDMSFANQFLSMIFRAEHGKSLGNVVVDIPPAQDQELARIKLGTMGVSIDPLTPEQVAYADNYLEGT